MSAPTAAPARSHAPYDWASRQPVRALAALVEADLATRRDTRISARHQVDARPALSGAPLPATCQAALHSLLARYTEIAARLANHPHPSHGHIPAQAAVADQLTPCPIADSDLEDILFFHHFSGSEITDLRDGLRVLSAPRGARIETHSTLWIVLRGAVQTSLRHGASSCRVRVAGPGRCVGHLSLIAHSRPNPQPVLEAELRERAILLEIPTQRANSILADDTTGAKRFAQAFNQDIAGALHDADSPTSLEHARALEHPPTEPVRYSNQRGRLHSSHRLGARTTGVRVVASPRVHAVPASSAG